MTDPGAYPPPPPGSTPPPGYGYAPAPAALTPQEDKQWSFWAHLGGIVGFLPSLIIFLVFKDRSSPTNPIQVRNEAKEALNWQITITIIAIAASIVVGIVSGALTAVAFAGYSYNSGLIVLAGFVSFLGWIPWIVNVIFSVVAALRVNGGSPYRYPFTFRFIK